MKDFVVEEILRSHIESSSQKARRGYSKPVIPAANRYPHSVLRAELEQPRQPWNRGLLGTNLNSGYRSAS